MCGVVVRTCKGHNPSFWSTGDFVKGRVFKVLFWCPGVVINQSGFGPTDHLLHDLYLNPFYTGRETEKYHVIFSVRRYLRICLLTYPPFYKLGPGSWDLTLLVDAPKLCRGILGCRHIVGTFLPTPPHSDLPRVL